MDYSPADLTRLNDNPLYHALGIRVEAVGDGQARSVLTPTVSACWPTPQPHGGVLFTLLDTTMAFAAQSNGETESGCATVDCSVQYLSAARSGPFVCTVATTLKTNRTAFVRGEIRDAQGHPVAMAQGTVRLFSHRREGAPA